VLLKRNRYLRAYTRGWTNNNKLTVPTSLDPRTKQSLWGWRLCPRLKFDFWRHVVSLSFSCIIYVGKLVNNQENIFNMTNTTVSCRMCSRNTTGKSKTNLFHWYTVDWFFYFFPFATSARGKNSKDSKLHAHWWSMYRVRKGP